MPDSEYFYPNDDERLSALESNAKAVKKVAAAVASTLGPKGLDTMLVNSNNEVVITNDGVTILELMEMEHPAAKMIVNVARAQQEEMGDGTTTATLLASALVNEGVKQVLRGVPVTKVIAGIERGVRFALHKMREKARPIYELDDEWLQRIAFTACRENEDITLAVIEAVNLLGREKLLEKGFKFSSCVKAFPRVENRVVPGILLSQPRMSKQMPRKKENVRVLVLSDSLEPQAAANQANGADEPASRQERLKEEFYVMLEHIIHLEPGLVVVGGQVDPHAEGVFADAGIMVVQNVPREELRQVTEHTHARMIKTSVVQNSPDEIESALGMCKEVADGGEFSNVCITGGHGKPFATIIVGAMTEEILAEHERIARDAASAVQAAIRGGFVPGGGAIELSIAHHVEHYRETVQGMERFGVTAVAEALQRPMSQVVANAGFNPLEKIESVKAFQVKRHSDSLGIDCDRGTIADMIEMGVVDPLLVKAHALKTASEVATAILRIHTIVRMKE
ncbi:MAG: TCP-1/cpn60 chaperonin family protein [Thermoactinomyces sp.]